jgi:hypothetical protein
MKSYRRNDREETREIEPITLDLPAALIHKPLHVVTMGAKATAIVYETANRVWSSDRTNYFDAPVFRVVLTGFSDAARSRLAYYNGHRDDAQCFTTLLDVELFIRAAAVACAPVKKRVTVVEEDV